MKNVNVLLLPEGVFSVKFSISMSASAGLVENGTLEYGLSYDTTSLTLSKNRQIISTRYELDPNVGVFKVVDSSLPYLFHEYIVRTSSSVFTISSEFTCSSVSSSSRVFPNICAMLPGEAIPKNRMNSAISSTFPSISAYCLPKNSWKSWKCGPRTFQW